MVRSRALLLPTILAVVMAGAAIPAAAQTPSLELSLGYQPLHLPNDMVGLGFNVDVAAPRNENWSLVGEFGMAHESDLDVSFNVFNLGAGPRFSWPMSRFTPFVQILAGAEVADAQFNPTGGDRDTAFMLQPGIGIYIPTGPRWGVIAQSDFRSVFFREEVDEQYRFVVGVRVGLR